MSTDLSDTDRLNTDKLDTDTADTDTADHPAATRPQALIGAALLAAGRPVRLRELAGVLGLSDVRQGEVRQGGEDAALRAVQAFGAALERAQLGITLEAVAGGYRLIVPPSLARHLAPLLAPAPLPTLSNAALEVLAIIAYRQPVTRAEIEAMRGAGAGTVLTLQERELVKVVGRSDAVGQPLLYGTTEKFLLEFGLSSLQELPPLEGADFSHLLRG